MNNTKIIVDKEGNIQKKIVDVMAADSPEGRRAMETIGTFLADSQNWIKHWISRRIITYWQVILPVAMISGYCRMRALRRW